MCSLVVIGVNDQGEKKFLTIEDGVGESKQNWREVLLDLKVRGMIKILFNLYSLSINNCTITLRLLFSLQSHFDLNLTFDGISFRKEFQYELVLSVVVIHLYLSIDFLILSLVVFSGNFVQFFYTTI